MLQGFGFLFFPIDGRVWAAREQTSPSSARSRRVRQCFDGMGVVEISLAEITSGYAVIQAQSPSWSARLSSYTQMTLSPGDKLGPYECIALIGKGGMGEAWKARDSIGRR